MTDDVTQSDKPTDRLTRLCDAMTETLDFHPEYNGSTDKCIIFLGDDDHGGIVMHGYEDPNEAIVDLFMHMKAMFRAQGKDIEFVGIPDSPEGLV